MEELWYGFVKAVQLIVSLDPEVIEITWRSLAIAATSSLLATAICIPLGGLIHFNNFFGKRTLINIIQTMYSMPTVVVGLLVFLLFSRAGPLGEMGLLFTPTVMVIGQALLIIPILIGLTISGLSGIDKAVAETAMSLGADSVQSSLLVMREARFGMLTAIVMSFGRAISEVGLAMMVGGNIRGFTRVLTTAIALETSKGDIELSIALGIILITVALIINIALNRLQQRK